MAKRVSDKAPSGNEPPKKRARKPRARPRVIIRDFTFDAGNNTKPRITIILEAIETLLGQVAELSNHWSPVRGQYAKEQPFAAIFDILLALKRGIRQQNEALILDMYKLALKSLDRVVTGPQFVAVARKEFKRIRSDEAADDLAAEDAEAFSYGLFNLVRDYAGAAFPHIGEFYQSELETAIDARSATIASLITKGEIDDAIERLLEAIKVPSGERWNLLYGKEASRKSRTPQKKAKRRGVS